MSRHLMARFRHLHAADDHGLHLDWAPTERARKRKHRGNFVEYEARLENGDHISVIGLEIGLVGSPYLWSIHVHDGHTDPEVGGWQHLDPGDHDHECPMCEAGPGEKCHPDCWDQNSRTGGGIRNTLEDTLWQDGSRGELWGYQPDREAAQRAAETAWVGYTGRQTALRDEVLNSGWDAPRDDLDDDYGDIFGEGR